MGICSSCESTSVETAKLIFEDGRLQEFRCPVKVSRVMQRNPDCFICNSDEMELDDVVSALSDDEELQPGQIYFALPLNRLRRRLQVEEMAALAVKASVALNRSVVKAYAGDSGVKQSGKVTDGGDTRTRRLNGERRRARNTAKLYAIPE